MDSSVLLPVANYPPWDERVADVVADVERPDETNVVVLRVLEDPDHDGDAGPSHSGGGPRLDLAELEANADGVEAAAERLADAGFDCDRRGAVADGDPANAILRVCAGDTIDRVYMYSRNRSPVGKALFGSTVQRVIVGADVPVTVVPTGT